MANSLLEAMAHGKAVLASNVEGNSSLVADGLNGLLYSSEDDFFAKAQRYILDADLRRMLGENGRAYVLQNCLPEKEALAYLDLYKKIS